MFETGKYVVYRNKGVCCIREIAHLDIPGTDPERLYYILNPVSNSNARLYLPIDCDESMVRPVMSRSEASALIDEIPEIGLLEVTDEKKREAVYKEAMKSCDCRRLVSVIKTLYQRRDERLANGKKVTVLDDRYLRAAEHELYDELSIALDLPKDQMQDYMDDWMGAA